MLTSESLQNYRARWQAVAEVKADEQREATLLMRWRQTNALLRLALDMGLALPTDDVADIIVVRQRWMHLYEAMGYSLS